MFENLLYQENISVRLRHDVAENTLPPAILFSGPAMSGKLTAALELARSLSCEKDAQWNCSCGHCRSHRSMAHPRTILAGNRDMTSEIAASAEVLRRDTSDASRFLLVRAAMKLLRRFDPVLWEGEEKKLVKTRPLMERLAESIDGILPGNPLPTAKKLEKHLGTLVDDCGVIQKSLPLVLPVAQVRHITSWSIHSAGGDHKTVIIDAAERMPIASRNALLKFLEEPPSDTTVIMLTDRKPMLLPTIISRLRDYSFKKRSPSEEAEVLRRVFREDEKRYGGLVDYFRAWRNGPSEIMKKAASAFIDEAAAGNPVFPKEAFDIKDQLDLTVFLEALSSELQKRWRDSVNPDHKRSALEAQWLREARIRTESLYMPVPLILKGLYTAMGTR